MLTSQIVPVLVKLCIIGVFLYLGNLFVTMDARFKTAINVLVCLCAFLYALSALTGYHVPGLK